jgi:hypothetical protein
MAGPSYKTGENVVYPLWLVFDRDGSVRMVRREPSLDRNERAMALSVRLPHSLWSTPSLSATITLAEGETAPSFNIDIEAASEALRSALGVDVHVVEAPRDPEP